MDSARQQGVTLDDVGERAGVSGKTVSRVVNGDPHVSRATRERVEEAIRATGYRMNMAARSLAASRSYLVGIFVPAYTSLYHAELYQGAAAACAEHGYHLLLEQYDEADPGSAIERYRSSLRNARCDGIILAPPLSNHAALLDALDADAARYVRIAAQDGSARAPAILADEEAGIHELVDYLWSLGHRRFGICSGPEARPFARSRNAAFIAAVQKWGGKRSDVLCASFSWEGSALLSGRKAGEILLGGSTRPDAIFAFNDELAHGVMTLARDMGLRVPHDLSIVGFDDGPAAQFAWPALTTIRQPIARMGAAAVEILTGKTQGPLITCAVELVVRDSCMSAVRT
ncbi:LacI family DNA-binding transcriptional regulator [Sphingobium sp. CAP-1]|uniref:LacI family DNA-binding transcriptional regulator n=1 Tax=Sphingobium sp. CAP-1 TaxID=2676077 RepID=UPI0012BB268A|nr:LacI family DNA-binding transcriptional regulator [Sphingobium sp. CAP-1]QGP79415.1 LacI family DNA-binding transcriptional regulator [Sphingobium sp. CAP-1]